MSPRVTGLTGVNTPPIAHTDLGFEPSAQQEAVFSWATSGRGNAIVEARAGSGKTTTLRATCQLIRGQACFLAFNKAIAADIQNKLEAAGLDWKRVQAGTFHSFGNRAWSKACGRNVQLDSKKTDTLCGMLQIPKMFWPFVRAAVSMSKQHLFGVPGYPAIDNGAEWIGLVEHFDLSDKFTEMSDEVVASPEEMLAFGIAHAQRVLRLSNQKGTEVIDFDDMIYLPILNGVRFYQFDWVLVDEAQDTNAARLELAARLLKPGGRMIAVGDPHQAIYGFTGAMSDAMELIGERFNCTTLPLTVSYRCSQEVIRFAQRWVPDIEAMPGAPAGSVSRITEEQFGRLTPSATDAILCRNNKPLVETAFSLIRRGIGCHVEGRDIGQGLIALARKWKSARTVGELVEKLDDYLINEYARLMGLGREMQAESLQDKVDTLMILCDRAGHDESVEVVVTSINSLFQDTFGEKLTTVTLSSVHKAKGREWHRVYLLGRDKYMPSRFAKQGWQRKQENNLIYVAGTRPQLELVEVAVTAKGIGETLAEQAARTAEEVS